MIPLLQKVYPNHNWKVLFSHFYVVTLPKSDEHTKVSNKAQKILFHYVNDLFPDVSEIHNNYSHPELIFSGNFCNVRILNEKETGKNMELDVFIPSLKLAFEYQGGQHYIVGNDNSKIYLNENLQKVTLNSHNSQFIKRDEEKRKACEKIGISLIEIPYWWDQSINSLATMIQQSISGKHKLIDPKILFSFKGTSQTKEMSSTAPSSDGGNNSGDGGANGNGNGDGNNNGGSNPTLLDNTGKINGYRLITKWTFQRFIF